MEIIKDRRENRREEKRVESGREEVKEGERSTC
jgi:hypothetical protein